MSELQVWGNAEFGSVRSLMVNGEPYFVGKDATEILGNSNPQKALRDHVDEEDRTVNESFTVNGTMGTLINESGLSAASSGDLISGINTALNTALADGGAVGDIVILVYIGGDMIDEIVVTAQQRMNLRSGGRQRRCYGSGNYVEGCCPRGCGSDWRDLPGIR